MMITLEHSYADLPESFYKEVEPSSAIDPALIALNAALAERLGLQLDPDDPALAGLLSGKQLPTKLRPIAMAYAGHQFGNFVPQLGDGRAILLGEVIAPDGLRFDLHLKGSGPTPFSRRGDGLASLGPVLREYIVSEAMYALGIPTTRALAACTTGRPVYRQQQLPGASIVRVARSHIRVGTFEYFAARRDTDSLCALADYAIARHDPDLVDDPARYLLFFERVARRQLRLVARWMGVGFIHGVMNTDNCSIAGETIDFGPCAFLDNYEADKVFSSIDHYGRYRYSNQGRIARWNLAALGNTLAMIVDEDPEQAVDQLNEKLAGFEEIFERELLEVMAAKLGIFAPRDDDHQLIEGLLDHMEEQSLDFTNTFRQLPAQLRDPQAQVFEQIRARLEEQDQSFEEACADMDAHNPWIIARNHQVERAIEEGREGSLKHFARLQRALARPYVEREEFRDLTEPPAPEEVVHQTFCGT